jgi:hypothetical protein
VRQDEALAAIEQVDLEQQVGPLVAVGASGLTLRSSVSTCSGFRDQSIWA